MSPQALNMFIYVLKMFISTNLCTTENYRILWHNTQEYKKYPKYAL